MWILRRGQKIQIQKSGFIWNTIVIGGGGALGQLVGVLLMPVLTRKYNAESFGILALFNSLLTILVNVASLNYEYAIPICSNDEKALNVLCGSLIIPIALIPAVALTALGSNALDLPMFRKVSPYLYLLPIAMALGGISNAMLYWGIRKKRYKTISLTRLGQSVMMAGIQLGIGLLWPSAFGLIIGLVLSRLAGIRLLSKDILIDIKKISFRCSPRKMISLLRELKDYPLIQAPASTIGVLGAQFFPLIIQWAYGERTAGEYFLTQRVIALPISMVSMAVSQVYIGEMCEMQKSNPRLIKPLFWRISQKMLLLGAVPTLIIMMAGRPVFSWVFGSHWSNSGIYASVMSLYFLISFAIEPYLNLEMLGKPKVSFLWNVIRIVGIALCALLAKQFGVGVVTAIAIYTVFCIVASAFKFMLWSKTIDNMSNHVQAS